MKKIPLLLTLTALLTGCESPTSDNEQQSESVKDSSEQLIVHDTYSLLYSEYHEQPRWVAYTLSKDEVYANQDRTDDFRADTMVSTGSAQLSDYRGSGYDRGHLKPAADSKGSVAEMSESFLLSNMSPQINAFNGGIWYDLEYKVRGYAINHDSIHVVTGPVLNNPKGTIGSNEVSIPEAFYKAVLSHDSSKTIAFLLPHESSDTPLERFVISVDSLEKVIGIDLFEGVPENKESSASYGEW